MLFAGGRYEVIRSLGHGGMGDVFEVRVAATGGRAALKTLRAAVTDDPDAVERFRREAIAMGRLEHPHIARCFDFGIEDDGSAFLVMELFDGGSLQDRLQDGPIPLEDAIEFGIQVASALIAAHDAGVVHRDLKPSNVVLTQGYDGKLITKVIDFGIASIKGGTSYQRLTLTGEIIGTPNYMAPEQLQAGTIDARTDVYGLGALVFALLAGHPPYPGRSLAEILGPLLAGERAKLSDLRPELEELSAIVDTAMAPDPEDRYPSAAAFREQLLRATVTSAPAPKRWGIAAAIAAFVGGIVLVLMLSTPNDASPSPDALTAEVPHVQLVSQQAPTVVEAPAPAPKPPITVSEPIREPATPQNMESLVVGMRTPNMSHMATMGRTEMDGEASAMMSYDPTRWDETWAYPPRIETTWMPDGNDPAPFRRLMNSRRSALGRCMERAGVPARHITVDSDFDNVRGTINIHDFGRETSPQCIHALLRPAPRDHPAARFTGPVRIDIIPRHRFEME